MSRKTKTLAYWFTWNPLKWKITMIEVTQGIDPTVALYVIQFGPLHGMVEEKK